MKEKDIEIAKKALRLISEFTDEDHEPTFEAKIAIEALSRMQKAGSAIDEN